MLRLRPTCPVDYRLCNQTVTVYHWDGETTNTRRIGETTYTRRIIENAFLDFRKTQNVDKIGSKEVNSFLLVIPGSEVLVAVGDKVMLGRGPECPDREAWAKLIPSKMPGMVVVRYVDPKYWNGSIVHTEAGG